MHSYSAILNVTAQTCWLANALMYLTDTLSTQAVSEQLIPGFRVAWCAPSAHGSACLLTDASS
jgi:hypothetical protein